MGEVHRIYSHICLSKLLDFCVTILAMISMSQ